jgi:hypothetical protein
VIEPFEASPIFIAEALKTAPEPDRLIVTEPLVIALFEIVVGVPLKFAYVPAIVAAEIPPTAASVRRILFRVLIRGVLSEEVGEDDRRRREETGRRFGMNSV